MRRWMRDVLEFLAAMALIGIIISGAVAYNQIKIGMAILIQPLESD